MNILVLSASTNEPGNADTLADAFIEGLQSLSGTKAIKITVKDLKLNQFTLKHYESNVRHESDFTRLQKQMEKASGLVIATPVWNFGVPAHLKNLIDRMGSFALDTKTRSKGTLNGKPFFLIFTGGAPAPAWKGLMKKTTSHIPEALRYFGGSYVGHHYEPQCTRGRGKFGLVVDKRRESLEAVRRKGESFAKIVADYQRTGQAPFRHRARSGIMRWGEKFLKKFF